MPKIFGKNIPPVVLAGAGILVGYLLYGVVFPSDDTTTTTRRTVKTVDKTVGDTDYLLSDYTFKIDPLPNTVMPKDAFRPLIIKGNGSQNGIANIDNFTYSGMAAIDDKAEGLLENSQTGQGDFVSLGEKWHDAWLVIKIDADEIELKNDNGDMMHLEAGAASQKSGPAPATVAATGNAPVNPLMVGPIGGQVLTVQPDQGQQGGGRKGAAVVAAVAEAISAQTEDSGAVGRLERSLSS